MLTLCGERLRVGVTVIGIETLAEQLKVVLISDGDTFTGLDSQNRQVKVRLHGIDSPRESPGVRQRLP